MPFQKTHGLHNTPEYRVWARMKRRCYNPNSDSYHRYGGRGIKVCVRWRNSFSNFYADMGPRPSPSHELDRKDNNTDYTPSNCRWSTHEEQCLNRRTTKRITWNGETLTISQWSEKTGILYNTLQRRISYGWSPKRALTKAVKQTRRQY